MGIQKKGLGGVDHLFGQLTLHIWPYQILFYGVLSKDYIF